MEEIKFSNQIRVLRFNHNQMSQKELADHVGCTRQTIIALEQNKYLPSLILAAKIAHLFRVSINDVFTFEFDELRSAPFIDLKQN